MQQVYISFLKVFPKINHIYQRSMCKLSLFKKCYVGIWPIYLDLCYLQKRIHSEKNRDKCLGSPLILYA